MRFFQNKGAICLVHPYGKKQKRTPGCDKKIFPSHALCSGLFAAMDELYMKKHVFDVSVMYFIGINPRKAEACAHPCEKSSIPG